MSAEPLGDAGDEPPRKQSRRAVDGDEAFEPLYLEALPCADMYEKSYMHRDTVTHVVVAPTGFVITASRDGQVKFWKKATVGLEFVKHFRAHLASINALALSADGTALATTSDDSSIKVFDVLGFDMVSWIKTSFIPAAAEFISPPGSSRCLLAVADRQSSTIYVFNTLKPADTPPLARIDVHRARVVLIRYNAPLDAVVSADAKGLLEYWSAAEVGEAVSTDATADDAPLGAEGATPLVEARLPASARFEFKSETDLYALAKAKATPLSLAFSADGHAFATTSTDWVVRVFHFETGKLRRAYDESIDVLQAAQRTEGYAHALDAFDFGRRIAVERELRALPPDALPPSNAIFDGSGCLLLYPCLLGIKGASDSGRDERRETRDEGGKRDAEMQRGRERGCRARMGSEDESK
jgi:peptidylprolyl isomerase domain and WD repeat-containing protein 1